MIKKIVLKFFPKKLILHLKPFVQRITKLDYIMLYSFYKVTCKKNDKMVLFLSDSRVDMSGNFMYIYNELKNYDYKINYVFKKSIKSKRTWKEKNNLCKLMAQSKYILVDDFYPIIYPIKLRKGTELIQVWHAMGAFKNVGYSRKDKDESIENNSLSHKNYTATIVSSENIRKDYAKAFGIDINKVHSLGIPRTDIFFNETYKKEITTTLLKKHSIIKGKKVILFAPTFRGSGVSDAHYDFSLIDFKKIKKELQKDYVFFIKLHPFIKNVSEVPNDDDFFINITKEREINDYLFITDILVTDYSSVIFENSLLNNDVVFFTPDLDHYANSRDFFYEFSHYTYGDVVKNTDDLIKSIKNPSKNQDKLKKFKSYFCSSCDGKSTKRVVEELIIKR